MWFLCDSGVKNKTEDIPSGGANNFLDVRNTTRKFWRNREPESQTWAESSRKALPCGRYQLWSSHIPLQAWGWTDELSKHFPLGQSIMSLGMWLTIGLSPQLSSHYFVCMLKPHLTCEPQEVQEPWHHDPSSSWFLYRRLCIEFQAK